MSFHSYTRECKMGQWADIPRSKCLPCLDTAVTGADSTSSYKHKEGCHPARWGTSGDKVGEWRKQGTALLPLICPLSCVHWSQKGGRSSVQQLGFSNYAVQRGVRFCWVFLHLNGAESGVKGAGSVGWEGRHSDYFPLLLRRCFKTATLYLYSGSGGSCDCDCV